MFLVVIKIIDSHLYDKFFYNLSISVLNLFGTNEPLHKSIFGSRNKISIMGGKSAKENNSTSNGLTPLF